MWQFLLALFPFLAILINFRFLFFWGLSHTVGNSTPGQQEPGEKNHAIISSGSDFRAETKKCFFIIYIEEDLFFGYYLTHEMCRAKRKNQKKNNFLISLCSSFLRSGGNLLCPVSNRLKAKNLIIVLIPDCKKRPYVLKQTCSSKLQLCLSMCDFSVTTIH